MKETRTTTDLLSQLIAFDTTSRNSNLELIDFIGAILQSHNVSFELTRDSSAKKANLFATLGQEGGQKRGQKSAVPGIVLSGHTDVVPVDGQNWDFDPFKTEVRDGRMYGRGTCDMKGFIAICLSRIEEILQADLPIPIHFAFSYDEEVGCIGVTALLEELKKKPVLPRACIIGEPTSMGVIGAHKGMLFKRCCVHGKSAHSSLVDQGVNAITVASKLISRIDDMQKKIQQEGPFDDAFDPPYTTLHSGVIHGGTVNNIIPNRCEFDFEIRNLPEQDSLPLFHELQAYGEQKLVPLMHKVSTETNIEWTAIADFPGMNTDPQAAIIRQVSNILNFTDTPGKVSYGTEGGHFQNAGIPSVICGPGSIEQAHKPNEYIDLDQLKLGETFISALIQSLKS